MKKVLCLLLLFSAFSFAENSPAVPIFTSAARASGANNSADFDNRIYSGVRLTLDITAVSGTSPTLDVKVQAKDTLSGKYVDITGASFTQKTGTGTDDLTIRAGIAAVANRSINLPLPRNWRVVATVGGTDTPTVTFTLAAAYLQ